MDIEDWLDRSSSETHYSRILADRRNEQLSSSQVKLSMLLRCQTLVSFGTTWWPCASSINLKIVTILQSGYFFSTA